MSAALAPAENPIPTPRQLSQTMAGILALPKVIYNSLRPERQPDDKAADVGADK